MRKMFFPGQKLFFGPIEDHSTPCKKAKNELKVPKWPKSTKIGHFHPKFDFSAISAQFPLKQVRST